MGEFADSKTLELEKSLLTVSKGQAQKPQPCPAHCELGWAKYSSGSQQAAGRGWNLALWKRGQTKVFLFCMMTFLPLLSAPTPPLYVSPFSTQCLTTTSTLTLVGTGVTSLCDRWRLTQGHRAGIQMSQEDISTAKSICPQRP